jgi:hypothetical protein
MLSGIRPVFEVVKEGRILKKIKHIQILIGVVFYLKPGLRQVLRDFCLNLNEIWGEISQFKVY